MLELDAATSPNERLRFMIADMTEELYVALPALAKELNAGTHEKTVPED